MHAKRNALHENIHSFIGVQKFKSMHTIQRVIGILRVGFMFLYPKKKMQWQGEQF